MKIVEYSVLVTVMILLRKLLWNRISRRIQYALWIFPVAFLLLQPFVQIESRFSMQGVFYSISRNFSMMKENGQEKTQETAEGQREDTAQNLIKTGEGDHAYVMFPEERGLSAQQGQMTEGIAPQPNGKDQQEWSYALGKDPKRAWTYLSAVVSICMGIAVVAKNLLFYGRCRRNRRFLRLIPQQKLRIYLLPGIETPFLLGRGIYLPEDMQEEKKQLRYMVQHEYCHYRHGDNFWTILRMLCIVLYWYHPFVWIANSYIKRDCELACDEAALAAMSGKEREEYGQTLMQMLRRSGNAKTDGLAASPMRGKVRKMKERLELIHGRKEPSRVLCGSSILVLALLTGCAFAGQTDTAAETATIEAPGQDTAARKQDKPAEKPLPEKNGESTAAREEAFQDIPYNVSAVVCGDKTYVFSENGVFIAKDDAKQHGTEEDWERIYDKPAVLGISCPELEDGIVFFYGYPEETEKTAILALHTASDKITTALNVGQDLNAYAEMYYEAGKLYCCEYLPDRKIISMDVLENGVLAKNAEEIPGTYLTGNPSTAMEQEMTALTEQESVERCSVYSPVYTRREGYDGVFITASDAQGDWSVPTDLLYQITEEGEVKKTEGITDILVTRKGIVGRDPGAYNDIWLWDEAGGTKQKIYEASENGDVYIGYNTYNEDGLFGMAKGEDGTFQAVKIGWDGEIAPLFEVKSEDATYPVHAQMSAAGRYLYYYNPASGRMEREKIR